MYRPTYAVTDEFPDDTEAIALHIILYCARNINHSFSRTCLADAFVKGLFGDVHELLSQDAAAADGNGASGIADEFVVNDSNIETYNVPELQLPRASETMDDLFVDRDADVAGVFTRAIVARMAITQKGTFCAVMLDPAGSVVVHFLSADPRPDERADFLEDGAGDGAGGPHLFEVSFGFEDDHGAEGERVEGRVPRQIGRCGLEDVAFPLTPALSIGEREIASARFFWELTFKVFEDRRASYDKTTKK